MTPSFLDEMLALFLFNDELEYEVWLFMCEYYVFYHFGALWQYHGFSNIEISLCEEYYASVQ